MWVVVVPMALVPRGRARFRADPQSQGICGGTSSARGDAGPDAPEREHRTTGKPTESFRRRGGEAGPMAGANATGSWGAGQPLEEEGVPESNHGLA